MKKILSVVLSIIMVTSVIFVMPVSAVDTDVSEIGYSVPDEAGFLAKLNQLRAKYPNGGTWSGAYYENGTAKAWQCFGYANQMLYEVFGAQFYNDGFYNKKDYNMGTIYAGDWVRIVTYGEPNNHSIFITKVTNDRVYFTDANWNGKNGIRWDASYTKAELAQKFSYKVHIPGNTLTGNGTPVINPQGCLDEVSSPSPGKIKVRGWAFDRDNLGASLAIHVYVGGPAGSGAPGYAITANKSRPDVNNAYPGVGNNHGFDDTISVSRTGSQAVYVYAINVGSGNDNPCLGSRTVTISSDSTAPTITNIYADSFTTTGYSLHCDLADDTELSRVVFYISTANVSQKSFTVATSGKQKTVTYDVKYSDFNNDTTDYTVGVWAYDTTGNVAKAPWTKVSPQNKSLKPTTEGEFNGHRYKYFKNQMSSEVAQKVCQKMGGHLVTINSKAENDYLVNLTKGYTGTAWIGSYYANEKWYWVKDEPFTYSNWKTGEPNNTNGNEYRVNMYVGGDYAGQWNDINAFSTNVEGFICEFENDIDTSKYYSSGIVRYNNHEYWLFNYGVDWDTANAVCESNGGHLLTIESEEENVTVTSLINQLMTKQEIWLGISDIEKEGVWKDVNGYSLSYTNWNTNEPNNTDNVEDFGMLLNTGKWNDTKSFAGIYRSTGFICEFDKIITSIDTEPSDTVSTNPTQPTTKPTETTPTTEPTTKPTETTVTEPTEAPTLPTEGTFHVVAGSPELCNGVEWDPASPLNLMTLGDDGVYRITYSNVPASKYEFKVTTNGAWDNGEFNLVGNAMYGGSNAEITVTEDNSTVLISFKESDMHANAYINGVLVDVGATEPTEPIETQPTTVKPTETTKPTQPTTVKPTESTACNHSKVWTSTIPSTYFTKGKKTIYCAYCGKVIKKTTLPKDVLQTPSFTVKPSKGSVIVKYKKVKDAKGFVLDCKIGKRTFNKTYKTTKSKAVRLTNIKRGTKVSVWIIAYTTSGSKKAYGYWSKKKVVWVK